MSALSTALLDELRGVVGTERVLTRPEELVVYGYDGAFMEGHPDVVVSPLTTAEVSGVMRVANRERGSTEWTCTACTGRCRP